MLGLNADNSVLPKSVVVSVGGRLSERISYLELHAISEVQLLPAFLKVFECSRRYGYVSKYPPQDHNYEGCEDDLFVSTHD